MKKLLVAYLFLVSSVCGCAAVQTPAPRPQVAQRAYERPPIDKPPKPALSFAGWQIHRIDQHEMDGFINSNGMARLIESYIHIRHGEYKTYVCTNVIITEAKENVDPKQVMWLQSDAAYTIANSETITVPTKDGWLFILYHVTTTLSI